MNKQEKQVTQEVEKPPSVPASLETHLYPDQFMTLMFDYGYETLRQHLEAAKASPEALTLLENLVVMHIVQMVYCKDQLVSYMWNQNAAETIGYISQAVVKLGGKFAPAPLDMIK